MSPEPKTKGPSQKVLVCGVNWIGDSVMSMPALQAFRRLNPEASLTLLVKPSLEPLWRLHPAVHAVIPLKPGFKGVFGAATAIRSAGFDRAYILPNSFRSALIPWLGGVRERIGMRGHWRSALLTKIALPPSAADRTHQAYEYIELMLPDHKNIAIDFPELRLPETMITEAQMKVASLKNPLAAILPGAARGPSKQWPARHFIELGRMLSEKGFGIVVLGSPKELPVCAEVADGTGSAAANLAGRTSLTELIALLKVCNVAVANDSGGMHLAAAVGTPVVGVYGMTDPSKTGPLCRVCRVVQNSSVRARDIARNSEEATKSLASVSPRQVYEAAMECMTTRESAP